MQKSRSFIYYLKSTIDFIFLLIFRRLYKGRSKSRNTLNTLFINTGNIGDLIISGKILETIGNSDNGENYYFLINEKLIELFSGYSGSVKLLGLNINSFKYNLIYRIRFLFKLKRKNIGTVYNLTSARATWNDILALAINATETYCYENTWETLIKVFPQKTDSFYTDFVSKNIFNEYERITNLYNLFPVRNDSSYTIFLKKFLLNNGDIYDIIIAPFASFNKKNWPSENFVKIIKKFQNDFRILILLSKEQISLARLIFNDYKVEFSYPKYSLNKLFNIISATKIFIGLESGMTHLALLTPVKILAIIGQADFGRYLPKPNDDRTLYFYDKCEFMGCEWHCKKDKVYCVENVSSQKIIDKINEILLHNENP